jgi:hypothetical protein
VVYKYNIRLNFLRFRKPLLYPFELWGRLAATIADLGRIRQRFERETAAFRAGLKMTE